MRRIRQKWRPALWQVVGGALLGTLGLSFLGLVALRLIGPEIGFRLAALIIGSVILVATLVLGLMLVRLILRPVASLAGRESCATWAKASLTWRSGCRPARRRSAPIPTM
jgi:two-component system, OmpR family, sensor kinase